MTNVMTRPPSPRCDRCGQPIVEAHYPDGRCPRPPRGARKAVAVTRAIAGVILIVVAALLFLRVAAGCSPSHHQIHHHHNVRCCISY